MYVNHHSSIWELSLSGLRQMVHGHCRCAPAPGAITVCILFRPASSLFSNDNNEDNTYKVKLMTSFDCLKKCFFGIVDICNFFRYRRIHLESFFTRENVIYLQEFLPNYFIKRLGNVFLEYTNYRCLCCIIIF